MDYPKEFSAEARNAVEAEIILAKRAIGDARRTSSLPSHYASYPTEEFEQAFLASIMRVFLVFASNAVELCRSSDWSLDRVDRESREFLRRFTITWRYEQGCDRAGNRVREVCGNWGGGLLRWIEEKFENRPEWARYGDLRLAAVDRKPESSALSQGGVTTMDSKIDSGGGTPLPQTISPGYVPSQRSIATPSFDLQRSFPSRHYSITGGPSDVQQRTDLHEEVGWLARKIQALEGPPGLSPSGALDRLLHRITNGKSGAVDVQEVLSELKKHCRASGVHLLETGDPDLAAKFEELAVFSETLESRYLVKPLAAGAPEEELVPPKAPDAGKQEEREPQGIVRSAPFETKMHSAELNPGTESARISEAAAGKNTREAAATERAARRQRIVNPILTHRDWTRGRLVTESGVGKGTVYEYLDGTREWIVFENGKAIADALGLKVEDLPDVKPA